MSTTTEKWTIFGERLKTELERQEMSLRQFAEKAGLTLTTACRYVHSQRTPRATEILKAAKVLGVTCDYMLGLSDDPHKTRDGWANAGFHELPSAQQRWIPFKTRPLTEEEKEENPDWDCILDCKLPEDGQAILISVNLRGHESVQYDEFYTDDGSYLDSGYEIGDEAVAWMSLPEPYQAERRTDGV